MNKPQKHNQQNQSQKQVLSQQTFYSGQMPPPQLLAQFEDIHPGFTNRLLTMVEEESSFKRITDRKSLTLFHQSTVLGIICALTAVLVVSGVAIYAIHEGFGTAAATIMGTSAAAVIIAFIQRRKRNNTKE